MMGTFQGPRSTEGERGRTRERECVCVYVWTRNSGHGPDRGGVQAEITLECEPGQPSACENCHYVMMCDLEWPRQQPLLKNHPPQQKQQQQRRTGVVQLRVCPKTATGSAASGGREEIGSEGGPGRVSGVATQRNTNQTHERYFTSNLPHNPFQKAHVCSHVCIPTRRKQANKKCTGRFQHTRTRVAR